MENILTARQFTDLCKSYGFKKLKANYFRCVGDGILQVISTQNREYMSPNSPYYSSTNRKSNTVSLGFISMYSVIPEYFFVNTVVQGFALQTYTVVTAQAANLWEFKSITVRCWIRDLTY